MKYIELNEVPTGTWHAIASEDLTEFSNNYWHIYMQYLMPITSDKVLKAESLDLKSIDCSPDDKDTAKSIKEWTLCRAIEKRGDAGHAEGLDQAFAITHAASTAKKPIRTLMFRFFQMNVPLPSSFIVFKPL